MNGTRVRSRSGQAFSAGGQRLRWIKNPLYAVLLAFTLVVMAHSLATPVFEAPDEVWHYNYVRWLAEGNGLPSLANDESGANQEVAQPPLYYAVAALISLPFPDDDLHDWFWGNPGFGYQAPGARLDNKNMLVHTARERYPWQGAVATLHITRMTSWLFGIVTLVSLWHLGMEVFQNRKSSLLLVSLVAFHPQFVFISSVVSNDSAAAALCTTALWFSVRAIRQELNLSSLMLCGLALGAAALSKTSALFLIPLSGAILLYAGLRVRIKTRVLITRLLLFALCIALAGGWWYARNLLLYGEPMGLTSHVDTPWGRAATVSYWDLVPEIPRLIKSFWAAYGWGHVLWPSWVYGVFTITSMIILAVGLVTAGKSILNRRAAGATIWQLPLMTYGMALGWLLIIILALLHWMRQVEAPHGRLLFPAMGAWAYLHACGLRARPHNRFKKALAYLFPGALACVTILAPGVRILPAFTPPKITPAAHVQVQQETPQLVYGGLAKVFNIDSEHVLYKPGDEIRVRACWEALQPTGVDYTVFVHLIGPGNLRVAERHTYPGLGRYPTSLWQVGTAFCETYDLSIEAWAPTPVLYQVEIGLFDTETGDRLPAVNNLGNPQEPPVVASLPVISAPLAGEAPKVPSLPAAVTFEDLVTLQGADVPVTVQRGSTINVTLQWQALRTLPPHLVTFIHLWKPGTPEPALQHDSLPNQGWFPTEVWPVHTDIDDTHPLSIPEDMPPGHYPVWAGIYRAVDGIRLRAVTPEGPVVNDLVRIGDITIE